MVATLELPALLFDGRDISEVPGDEPDVHGYQLTACPHCGAIDAMLPQCCDPTT